MLYSATSKFKDAKMTHSLHTHNITPSNKLQTRQ